MVLGRYSTRLHLIGLVTAVVVPLIAFAAFVLYQYSKSQQARVEQEVVRIAAQTALLVEAELNQLTAKLQGLASSFALARDDLETFHGEAAALTDDGTETIILRDLGVRQLFNSQLVFGAELPAGPPFSEAERENFARGLPYISDVYASPRSGEPRVVVALPILRNGYPKYVLGITIPTSRIRAAFLQAVPEGFIVSVGDRRGAFVARSVRHDEVTGKPGSAEYVARVVGKSGSFKSPNFEGRELLAGYFRSSISGWFFTANVPTATIEEPLQVSLKRLGLVGVAALLLSCLMALGFSQTIVAAARALSSQAHVIGQGGQVNPVKSSLIEFAVVGDALVSAGKEIAARAVEKARSTEREALLASIFDAAGLFAGIVEWKEEELRFIAVNKAASSVFVNSRDNLVDGDTAGNMIEFNALCRRSVSEGVRITAEFDIDNRTFLGTFTPLVLSEDSSGRVSFSAMDISDRKRAEVHRQLLVNELNHRVKNSLATAQSIAAQTLRSSRSISDARSALSARLVSLATTHDVLTRSNWEGANVEDIVAHAIHPFGSNERIFTAGPTVRLLPSQALSLAMVLHELLTNASKYGALSSDRGTIQITWRSARGEGESHRLAMEYQERDGPPVTAPDHKGFGSRLFAATFVSQKDGSLSLQYLPDGVLCKIEIATGSSLAGVERNTDL